MEPFNAEGLCPKCGADLVGVTWCAGGEWWSSRHSRCNTIEHLHRLCTRCSYEWLESCLDVKDVLVKNNIDLTSNMESFISTFRERIET